MLRAIIYTRRHVSRCMLYPLPSRDKMASTRRQYFIVLLVHTMYSHWDREREIATCRPFRSTCRPRDIHEKIYRAIVPLPETRGNIHVDVVRLSNDPTWQRVYRNTWVSRYCTEIAGKSKTTFERHVRNMYEKLRYIFGVFIKSLNRGHSRIKIPEKRKI